MKMYYRSAVVVVHPSQVENMKKRGWKLKKPSAVKPIKPITEAK